jgi:hypothetical protein
VIMDSNPLRCRTDELRLVGHAAPSTTADQNSE